MLSPAVPYLGLLHVLMRLGLLIDWLSVVTLALFDQLVQKQLWMGDQPCPGTRGSGTHPCLLLSASMVQARNPAIILLSVLLLNLPSPGGSVLLVPLIDLFFHALCHSVPSVPTADKPAVTPHSHTFPPLHPFSSLCSELPFIFCCYCGKWPPKWLQTAQIYFLTVIEVGRPNEIHLGFRR